MKSDTPLRILVVEDNPGDYFLVVEYLQGSGVAFDISHAKSLLEAQQQIEKKTFDVILLDLWLPDSLGPESVNSVVQTHRNIPIIVLTGFDDRQYGIDSLKMGAEDYLVKDDINGVLLVKSILYSIERSKVRKQMTRKDRLFRVITERSVDAKILIDEEGKIMFATESITSITGFTSAECIGKNEHDIIHPDDIDIFYSNIRKVTANNKALPFFDVRIKHKNGHYIWCRKNIVNLLGDEQVKAIVCTFWDITNEKLAAETLKASEERYRNLFEVTPATIIIWDPATMKVLEVNATAIKDYGYSREEFKRLNLLDLRDEQYHEKILELAQRFLYQEGYVGEGNWIHRSKDGREMTMHYNSHTIDFNGTKAVLALGQNITEKIALEKMLESERHIKQQQITDAVITAQEQEREEIARELHDNINQILAGSRLYLGLVKKEFEHPYIDETDKLLKTAIEELRTLSHALVPPSLKAENFLQSLDNVIEVFTVSNAFTIEKQLDHFNQDKISDKMRLTIYRIIQEQLNNVMKYASATKVWLKLKQEDDTTLLSIKDNGVGFDPAEKKGGIGLLNIKTRASLFNGEVTIRTAPGKGCELMVCFNG